MNIPILETERLSLRAGARTISTPMPPCRPILRSCDSSAARRRERCLARHRHMLGHWVLRGHGMWAVERKSDGALIGRVGVQRPESWPATEVAWTLGRPYWGQGYATEAAKASLDWGFKNLPLPKLASLIDAENFASQAVAKRLGQTKGPPHTLVLQGKSYPVDVWEIPRERWTSDDTRTVRP